MSDNKRGYTQTGKSAVLKDGMTLHAHKANIYTVPENWEGGTVRLPSHIDDGETFILVDPFNQVPNNNLIITGHDRLISDGVNAPASSFVWDGTQHVLNIIFTRHIGHHGEQTVYDTDYDDDYDSDKHNKSGVWMANQEGAAENVTIADYVIVGLGTAGCPLARYLSEDMTTSVIVLEAGQNYGTNSQILKGAPLGDPTLANDPRFSFARLADSADISAGLAGTYNYSDGRLWGGSSAHNGLVALRSPPDVYDQWGLINPQWAYNNLLPVMLFFEKYTPDGTVADPAQRGSSGPLYITQDEPLSGNHFYTDLTIASNSPPISDYNNPTLGDVGIAANQWFVSPPIHGGGPGTNQRSWSQTAFLPSTVITAQGQGVGGRKLSVVSNATATEIILDAHASGGPKATGVRYIQGNDPDKIAQVIARKKVILCAGSIANAAILQLSGIGPSDLLSGLGIPVVLANDNVGANMQNHYGPTMLIAQDVDAQLPPFEGSAFFSDLSGNVVGAYNLGPPDGVRRFGAGTIAANFYIPHAIVSALGLDNTPSIGFLMFNLEPNSLGTVRISSRDALTAPSIKFRYYQDTTAPTDMDRTIKSYKVIANIAQEYGTTVLYPPVAHFPAPYGPAPDDSLLEQDAKDVTLIAAYHATGTCRMSSSAATGVVDGNLDVFGVQSLSCADCSVIPVITKGNTAYPAYLIGLVKAKIEGAPVPF